MTLIATLLGIAIDRYFGYLYEYRHYRHFQQYVSWLQKQLPENIYNGLAGLVIVVVPIVFVVFVLQVWLGSVLFGSFFTLLFAIVVMVYSLGPRDLAIDTETYCKVCDLDDMSLRSDAAIHLTETIEPPADTKECISRVVRATLAKSNDYMFAVVFWFVLIGPVGAILYRLLSVLYKSSRNDEQFLVWVTRFHQLFSWIPARLTALGYAFSGDFDNAMTGWRMAHKEKDSGILHTDHVLIETGLGALNMRNDEFQFEGNQPVRFTMKLIWRTLTIWLVALAVMTLAGWAV